MEAPEHRQSLLCLELSLRADGAHSGGLLVLEVKDCSNGGSKRHQASRLHLQHSIKHMPASSELWRWRQTDQEFKVPFSSIASLRAAWDGRFEHLFDLTAH